jgi:hypothetical protein
MHYSSNFMKNNCWLLLKLLTIDKIFGFADVNNNYIVDDASSIRTVMVNFRVFLKIIIIKDIYLNTTFEIIYHVKIYSYFIIFFTKLAIVYFDYGQLNKYFVQEESKPRVTVYCTRMSKNKTHEVSNTCLN